MSIPNFLELFNVEKVGLEASTYIAPLYRGLVREGFQVLVSHRKKTRFASEAARTHKNIYELSFIQKVDPNVGGKYER